VFGENVFERKAVVNDHVLRREKGFGEVAAVRSPVNQDFILFPGNAKSACVDKDLDSHQQAPEKGGSAAATSSQKSSQVLIKIY